LWTFAVGLAVVAGAVAVVVLRTSLLPLGTDITPTVATVVTIPPGARACEPQVGIGTGGALKLYGSASGGVVRARLEPAGLSPGAWAELSGSGPFALPLTTGPRTGSTDTVCIANGGPGSLALTGFPTGPDLQATLDGSATGRGIGRPRIDVLAQAHPRTTLSILGHVPGRIAAAVGTHLAPVLAIAGFALGLVLLVVLAARPEEDDARR